MSGVGVAAVVCLLGLAVCILVWAVWQALPWAARHRERPQLSRSYPSHQDLVIDNLRTMYFEDQIEADEFEARLWQAMTGASDALTIAGAEAIAASKPREDEVFRIMHEAKIAKSIAERQATQL